MSPIDGTRLHAAGEERTLADRAFTALHDAIVEGALEPGERLPIEDVARALSMSPMPIREALRRLDAVGLVENIPHRGARVTELSIDDLKEIYDARIALESLAVRRAAERISPEELDAAQDALTALGSSRRRSGESIWDAHQRFHFTLYGAAGSAWLVRLITPLWESSERYRVSIVRKGRFDMRQAEHEAIFDAVSGGDGDRAADLLHDHLAQTANDIASKMGRKEPLIPRHEPQRRKRVARARA